MLGRSMCAALAACVVSAAPARSVAADQLDDRAAIDGAVTRAVGFLTSRIGPDGACLAEFAADNPRFGGKTALCVHALVTGGVKTKDPADPVLVRSLKWLRAAKLNGTYAVAMRANALADLGEARDRRQLARDAEWLIRAAGPDGTYTYAPDGRDRSIYDNSNSQMAVLGVWAAARRGIPVPKAFWRLVETHWRSTQQPDGGWAYFVRPGTVRANTYGSMTAAGLATVYLCFENLYRGRFVRCSGQGAYEPAVKALAWLGKRFSVAENPKKGIQWLYYWLYSVERVALASGRKYFGDHNWFAEGAAELVDTQNRDGSWSHGPPEARVASTAFALLFLARGRHPVLVNKLSYKGKWNSRPRDAANFARYVTNAFERPVAWQVVDVDSPDDDWHDAPILYVSGAGACEFSDKHIAKLRNFALRGGLIVSEAACNSGAFTLDMQRTYRLMFPELKLERLPDDHDLYTHNFKPTGQSGLTAVSNGVRLLAIHAPRELSLELQLGQKDTTPGSFELLANAYLLITDKGKLAPRGRPYWASPKPFKPVATVRLARVQYGGDHDPEPLAWRRLAVLMGNRYGIELKTSEPTPMTALDPARWPVATMTGSGKFKLTGPQIAGLVKYLQGGGTLIVHAAGGSARFIAEVNRQIVPAFGERARRRLAHSVIYGGPAGIKKVHYRRQFSLTLTRERRNDPRIDAVIDDGRAAIIISDEDLLGGLIGCSAYRIRGYRPDSAVALMTNLLSLASKEPGGP